jgi:hypothetical protein
MLQFADQGLFGDTTIEEGEHTYDLALAMCVEPSEYFGDYKATDRLPKLVPLAATVLTWSADFRRLGVPERVWKPLVTNYEDNQLPLVLASKDPDLGYKSEMPRIASALNRYRLQSNASLPKFVVDGGCGAGDVRVRVVLRPRSGRIFFIPRFAYLVCEKQGIDSDDTIKCDRWREAIDGSLIYVAGDYIYLARWADGTVRKGPLGFNSPDQDGATFYIGKDGVNRSIKEPQ